MITDQKPSYRKWYLALTIVIAAILLVLAIRGVSWPEMVDTLRKADPTYLCSSSCWAASPSLSAVCAGVC